MAKGLPKSALEYVIKGLIPFTEANIKLAFKPGLFFNDLETISRRKKSSLQNAFYRAQHEGLVALDNHGVPYLTTDGLHYAKRFVPTRLASNARLMVVFDIPEREAWKRQHLRRLLRTLGFKQIQKSVWVSDYDYRDVLGVEIRQYRLRPYIKIYEALQI